MSMDLEYTWQQFNCDHKGGQLSYSLMITCKRWFRTEKVAFKLVDGSGQIPPKDGYIELAAGMSFRIDYDTYGWDWCDGDYIIIFDKKGREYDRQIFRKKTYVPGQCPECHGSHQCAACHGTGRITDQMHMISTCPRCLGTGVCQTCYVPTRAIPSLNTPYGSTVATNMNSNVEGSRQRRMIALQKRIAELREMINRCDYDEKMRKLNTSIHGYDTSMTMNDMQQAQLKYTYQQQLQQLQYELEQLESGGF